MRLGPHFWDKIIRVSYHREDHVRSFPCLVFRFIVLTQERFNLWNTIYIHLMLALARPTWTLRNTKNNIHKSIPMYTLDTDEDKNQLYYFQLLLFKILFHEINWRFLRDLEFEKCMTFVRCKSKLQTLSQNSINSSLLNKHPIELFLRYAAN